MKFYRIRHSLNSKILGNYPQVKSVINNCHVSNNPNFIDRFPFKKIEGIIPIMSNPVLYPKSKKTDLISVDGIGFSFGALFISDKLKNILESHSYLGIQFFKNKLIHNKMADANYWQAHVAEVANNLIDFTKSEIQVRVRKSEGGTELHNITISSLDEFYEQRDLYKKSRSILLIKRLFLKENINESLFALRGIEGGFGYIVSEKLKLDIEKQGCTGIEFQPIQFTLNEWLQNEREKTYGKS